MTPASYRVLAAVRRVLGTRHPEPVALHEPSFQGREWEYVRDCLDTGWVSSAGGYVDRFEESLAEYTGVRHAVAVVNGTAALHVALLLAGVEEEDEVLVPALTFVATANAVSYCRAIPHFVDIGEDTLGLDPEKLETHLRKNSIREGEECRNLRTGRRIRAVVPVHTFGHPVDLDGLTGVCQRHGLAMVEDAAEAMGSLYRGQHVGRWGRVSILSFNGNKVITTGGGGAILTEDDDLADHGRHLTTTGKVPHPWRYFHDTVAFNFRLPNINAALGCAQLERLEELLRRKRALASRYREALAGVPGIQFVQEPPFARSNYWLNAILLDEVHAAERDEVLRLSNAEGFSTRPAWDLLCDLPMYARCPAADLSTSRSVQGRLVNLPSSPGLGPGQAPDRT